MIRPYKDRWNLLITTLALLALAYFTVRAFIPFILAVTGW